MSEETIETWKGRHAEEGQEPAGALRLWFEACLAFGDEARREIARQAIGYLTIPLKKDAQWDRRPSNLTFVERLERPAHHHIWRSYAAGSSPEDGYQIDPSSFELDVVRDEKDSHGRGWVVAVRSSGADSPRSIYLRQSTKTGLWFVNSFSTAYVGVRPPKDPEAEEFV